MNHSVNVPRNESYRNIDRDLLGRRDEHLQGRIPHQERHGQQTCDNEWSYGPRHAPYSMTERDYYTEYHPPPARSHGDDQIFPSLPAQRYTHPSYDRQYPPHPPHPPPQPRGVLDGWNQEEDAIRRLSDSLIRQGLKVHVNSCRDSSGGSECSSNSATVSKGSRCGQDESKRNKNMKRLDAYHYNDCINFYSESGCKKGGTCEYRHAEEARHATEECAFYQQNKCRNLHCDKRHTRVTRYLQSKPKGDDIIVCPIQQPKGFCDDPLRKNAHKEKTIDKNPEEEIWGYVCEERDARTRNVIKLSIQNVYVKELLSMDFDIFETSSPIPALFSEICASYVEGDCDNLHCPYWHSKATFAWQVAESRHLWINLTEMQNMELELAYCNPSKVQQTVQVLDKSHHQDGDPLLRTLSLDSWMAYFDNGGMKMVAASGREIRLRRLSTSSIVTTHSDTATVWIWYFEDDDYSWKEITKIDGTSKGGSEVLEKLFSDRKYEERLSIAGNRYEVDLTMMTQKNVVSRRVRNLRRRPVYRENTTVFKDDRGTSRAGARVETREASSRGPSHIRGVIALIKSLISKH